MRVCGLTIQFHLCSNSSLNQGIIPCAIIAIPPTTANQRQPQPTIAVHSWPQPAAAGHSLAKTNNMITALPQRGHNPKYSRGHSLVASCYGLGHNLLCHLPQLGPHSIPSLFPPTT
jgi:hypothetical protein